VTTAVAVTKNKPEPGDYGVSHGSGMAAELIRHATSSWAGHAFIYVGENTIVEGTAPCTRLAHVSSHPDARWNWREELTAQQRTHIVSRAHALVGTPYDWPAYIGLALEILSLKTGKAMSPYFQNDTWRVCSADVADCYSYAGIDLTQGLKYPNLVTPADLYDRLQRL